MSPSSLWRPIAVAWLGVAAAWTPAALLASPDSQWSLSSLLAAFVQMLIHFAPWALAVPLFHRLSRRWPIGLGQSGRNMASFAMIGLVAIPVFTAAGVVAARLLFGTLRGIAPEAALTGVGQATLITGLFALPTFAALVAIGQTMAYFERYRERERLLADSRASALRAQLAPHFLFNALNAIAALGHYDPRRAEHALVSLSGLLRDTLDRPDRTRLRDEVAFIADYVELHRLLLGDRLTFELDIGTDAWDAELPALLLQPLIENALVHGISRLPAGGMLTVRARTDGGRLEIVVANDAPAEAHAGKRSGLGLANVRQRLAAIHGPAAELSFERGPAAARAALRLPIGRGVAP